MTTENYLLSNFNITIESAANLILDYVNSNNLNSLYNLLLEANVNNDMVADILQSQYQGLTGDEVKNFFNLNNLDGNALEVEVLDNSSQALSFAYSDGMLTNTSSSSIIVEDIGFDMEGSFNFDGLNYSYSMSGSIENGFSVYAEGANEYVPGSNFIDLAIAENSGFNLNDFLPDNIYEDIPGISGFTSTEYTLFTNIGNFNDSTSVYF